MSVPDRSADDLAAWDADAERYAQLVAGPEGPVTPELRRFLHRSLGDLAGQAVLDLGCGSGWLSGEVAELGGQVLGIDGSERLLAIARSAHPSVEFLGADLTEGLPDLGLRRFDRVVAQMVLMHLARLDALLADIGRCLRPNGRFIFTVPHPAFDGGTPAELGDRAGVTVDGYLRHRVHWVDTAGGHRQYHRPVGWYVDLLAASGMAVVSVLEAAGAGQPEGWPADVPALLGVVAIPVTPGLGLPVGRPSPLAGPR